VRFLVFTEVKIVVSNHNTTWRHKPEDLGFKVLTRFSVLLLIQILPLMNYFYLTP